MAKDLGREKKKKRKRKREKIRSLVGEEGRSGLAEFCSDFSALV